MSRSPQSTPSWVRVALGLASVAAVVVAIVIVGPASSALQVSRRVITVEKGVVQSTVSASGSLQPANELNVNFKTGGTLLAVDVRQGEHVYEGQLLAELDPQSANVAVEQAQAGVDSAQAKLAAVEADPSGAASSASGTGANANTNASAAVAQTASYTPQPARAIVAAAPTPTTTTTPTTTPTTTTTTPTKTAPTATKKTTTTKKSTTTTKAKTTPAATTPTVSPATEAANIAAAKAAVDSAELSLKAAEITQGNTKLYAPADGTIATLSSAQPGDTVSAGATGAAAASSSAASGTGTGTGTGGGGGTGTAAASTSSSSSAFIVLVDLSGMDLVVPLSESDITKVKVGQTASVTVNALTSSDFEAHVTSVATLPSTSSGVVSYDVTLHLDQLQYGLRPGMTASAQIVVSQAQGAVSLPSAAISRAGGQSTVTVVKNGKDVVQPVVTGIVGDSATQIVSGLTGGEQVVISTSTSLGASAASATGAAAAGGGFAARALGGGGGGFGGGGGGGAARRGG